MPKVFISYRREDSNAIAGRIYDRLVEECGRKNVFKDVDSIPLGTDFRQVLSGAVGQCDVFLPVIGKAWADATDQAGERRLAKKTDFVRVEVEAALERGIPVIPLLVDGASVPGPEELPESLRDLSFRNGAPIRYDPDFHRDMDRVIAGLKQCIRARSKAAVKDVTSRTSSGRWLGAGIFLLLLVSGVLIAWQWQKGDLIGGGRVANEGRPPDQGIPAQQPVTAQRGSAPTVAQPPATTPPIPPQSIESKPNPKSEVSQKAVDPESAVRPSKGVGGDAIGNTELAAMFRGMVPPRGQKKSINVALWIASPIKKSDQPIFSVLADVMWAEGARLVEVSLPGGVPLQELSMEATPGGVQLEELNMEAIIQAKDPRMILDNKNVDAILIYGIDRDGAAVPESMDLKAPTPTRRTHMALVWTSQVGKDSFLIVPEAEKSVWKPSRLPQDQLVDGEDAVSAAVKYSRIVDVGNSPANFSEFFRSVKSREKGPSHITNLVR